jgi:phosphate transport system substrate-binding protein
LFTHARLLLRGESRIRATDASPFEPPDHPIITRMKSTIITSLLAVAFTASLSAQNALRLRGSDTLGAKLVPQWAEGFKKKGGSAVSFDIAAEGSSTAFTNLAAGTADIGMSSRKVKDEERTFCKTKGVFLKEVNVAWDMITIVVNKGNPVQDLTKKQIAGIFSGAIKDWSEVGGTPGAISVYTRNTSSGTYKDFQGLAMGGKDYGSNSQKMAGNEQIAAEVGNNKNGIGYCGLAYSHAKGIKMVNVDGKQPEPSTVKSYPLSRPTFFYTNGDAKGAAKEFIDFCLSAEGDRIAGVVGFVPLSVAK